MPRATGRVGGSYSYNYTCPVCGQVWKRSDMRLRWDGQLVCPPDWEPRQPLDFFRTRDDTHRLDRISRDIIPASESMDGITGGWVPGWTHITLSTNSVALNGTYRDDTLSTVNKRNLVAEIKIPFTDNVVLSVGNATTQITLPSSPNVAGTYILETNHGRKLASGSIPSGSATLSLTTTAVTVYGTDGNITFSGNYGL